MIRLSLSLLPFLASLGQEVDSCIERLTSESAESREAASQDLLRIGPSALPSLRTALQTAEDVDLLHRLRLLIERIKHDQAVNAVDMELVLSNPAPDRWCIDAGRFPITIRFTNGNNSAIFLWTRFTLEVLRPDGKPAERNKGLWPGVRENGCHLNPGPCSAFISIDPKQSLELPLNLSNYERDPEALVLGWSLLPGEHTLVLTYSFRREAFLRRCPSGKECTHDDPVQPWNRALEFERTLRVPLNVTEGRPLACPAHLQAGSWETLAHSSQGHLDRRPCRKCGDPTRSFQCDDVHPQPPPAAKLCFLCSGEHGLCVLCGEAIPPQEPAPKK